MRRPWRRSPRPAAARRRRISTAPGTPATPRMGGNGRQLFGHVHRFGARSLALELVRDVVHVALGTPALSDTMPVGARPAWGSSNRAIKVAGTPATNRSWLRSAEADDLSRLALAMPWRG